MEKVIRQHIVEMVNCLDKYENKKEKESIVEVKRNAQDIIDLCEEMCLRIENDEV